MKKEKKIGVALAKEACPSCGKLIDGPIIMNTRLTEHNARKVKELHGKAIEYLEEPCEECQKFMKMGFLIIGVVRSKSGETIEDIYRSGNRWVIKTEKAHEMFGKEFCSKGLAFLDVNDAISIGLTDVNINA